MISFEGSDYPHLWYLYMIIGLYFLIPILRLFVKKENKNYILLLIIGSILVLFIPTFLDFLTVGLDVTLKEFVDLFFLNALMGLAPYLLIGWYLTNFKISKRNRFLIYISTIILMIICFIAFLAGFDIRSSVTNAGSIVSLLWGATLFLIVINIYGDRKNDSVILSTMSKFVFGVYIIHIMILEVFVYFILPYNQFALQSPILYMIITFLFVFILSYLVVYLVSKVKYLRKIFYIKN